MAKLKMMNGAIITSFCRDCPERTAKLAESVHPVNKISTAANRVCMEFSARRVETKYRSAFIRAGVNIPILEIVHDVVPGYRSENFRIACLFRTNVIAFFIDTGHFLIIIIDDNTWTCLLNVQNQSLKNKHDSDNYG
jgi:hypothetical protein